MASSLRVGSKRYALVLILATVLLAPIRNPNYEQGNYWGGNQNNGWGDCTLRIQDNPGFCGGGYTDDDPEVDLYWYVDCDDELCYAATECPDGTIADCEGEYKGQAGEGIVYCYDNGSGVHTDVGRCP